LKRDKTLKRAIMRTTDAFRIDSPPPD